VAGDIERRSKHSALISYHTFETEKERETGKVLFIHLKKCLYKHLEAGECILTRQELGAGG